jgi:hypothetical protein
MATNRRIDSPGVQISEVDLSLRPVQNTATNILIPGFSQKGPINDVIQVASVSEFQQIYGLPTNGAERYFYSTVNAALQSPGNILVSRLPYGTSTALTATDQVGVLAYPAIFVDTMSTQGTVMTAQSAQTFLQTNGTYMLGAPHHYTISKQQFTDLKSGSLFTFMSAVCANALTPDVSTLGYAALIIANQSQSTINNVYEGYYVGIADNTNLNPQCNFDTINYVTTVRSATAFIDPLITPGYQVIPPSRLGFTLSATSTGGFDNSLSEVLESSVPSFDIYSGREYDDTLVVGLFKLNQSVFSNNSIELAFSLTEGYIGSLDRNRQINSTNGGPAQSFFLETVVNNQSSNLVVKVNPYLSRVLGGSTYLSISGTPAVKIRATNPTLNNSVLFSGASNSTNRTNFIGFDNTTMVTYLNQILGTNDAVYPLGAFYASDNTLKTIGNVPAKLGVILDTLLNTDVYQINVMCEGGLGTVFACANNNTSSNIFDDYRYVDTSALSAYNGYPVASNLVSDYQGVVNEMRSFIENPARKDLIGIIDPLTPILVQSNSVKTITKDNVNFTQNILWPLKNLYAGFNTSYLCVFPQVVRITDESTGNPIWVPFSGYAAAIFANTDSYYTPWSAPAGFTRGVVPGITDIAYYPRQKERDQLYKSNFNPVTFFASDGFIIYGQKTMLTRPSAFDRINVRRLFLNLEIATRETLKYFVFEPNTLFTRTQIINTLTPLYENAKNTDGVYDYLIICDERNNTPAVIDDNTLIVDIYLKPVRTAEFILANFYATSTGVSFQEITG